MIEGKKMGFLDSFQEKNDDLDNLYGNKQPLVVEKDKKTEKLFEKSQVVDQNELPVKESLDKIAPQVLPEIPKFVNNVALDPQNIPHFPEVTAEHAHHIINETHYLEQLPVINTEDAIYEKFKFGNLSKPLFVRTDKYSVVLSNLDTLKEYIEQSSDIIYSLENLKRNADIEHKSYKNTLEDIQRKLIYVDKIIFES